MITLLSPPFRDDTDLLFDVGVSGTEVVVFIDYAAYTVRRMHEIVDRSAEKFRKLSVTLAYRFVTPEDPHHMATLAARAAIAAGRQGSFPEMHNALLESDGQYSHASLQAIARRLHLDVARFSEEMFAPETEQKLMADRASAQASAETVFTPMLFINGKHYIDSWDDAAIYEAVRGSVGSRLTLASYQFINWAASASLVLLLATCAAFAVVNLGGTSWYRDVQESVLSVSIGSWFQMGLSFEHLVNDGLMALFFLVVGIEIKREFISGELANWSTAVLPLLAAIGGMAAPALIYVAVNADSNAAHGWGVPVATDIAFVLGILALLGDRVPASLKVFVSALAIADDIGAIIIIALFYGHGFHLDMALWTIGVYAMMLSLNRGRIYAKAPYVVLGVVLWYCIFQSGIHATLAGVLTALAIPARPSAQTAAVAAQAKTILDHELKGARSTTSALSVLRLQRVIDRLRDPGFHLQHYLENWNSFLILPLFAFLNMGVVVVGVALNWFSGEVVGTVLGLVIGKPLGICLAVYLAVRSGAGRLSEDITWIHLIGAACLAGIGFTMSIFIASAAFDGNQLQSVKVAVLVGSALSVAIGVSILLSAPRKAVSN